MPKPKSDIQKRAEEMRKREEEIRKRAEEMKKQAKETKNKNSVFSLREAVVENGETNINIPTAMEYENGMIKDAKQYNTNLWSSLFPQSATPIKEFQEIEKMEKRAGKSNKKKKQQKKRTMKKTTKKRTK